MHRSSGLALLKRPQEMHNVLHLKETCKATRRTKVTYVLQAQHRTERQEQRTELQQQRAELAAHAEQQQRHSEQLLGQVQAALQEKLANEVHERFAALVSQQQAIAAEHLTPVAARQTAAEQECECQLGRKELERKLEALANELQGHARERARVEQERQQEAAQRASVAAEGAAATAACSCLVEQLSERLARTEAHVSSLTETLAVLDKRLGERLLQHLDERIFEREAAERRVVDELRGEVSRAVAKLDEMNLHLHSQTHAALTREVVVEVSAHIAGLERKLEERLVHVAAETTSRRDAKSRYSGGRPLLLE